MEGGAGAGLACEAQASADGRESVGESLQTAAGSASCPAAAVVSDLDVQSPVLSRKRDDSGSRPGVLGDVGERFRDEEVGCRFDRRRIPTVVRLNGDRDRCAIGKASNGRSQSLLAED